MSKAALQPTTKLFPVLERWLSTIVLIVLNVATLPLLKVSLARLVDRLLYPYPNDGLEGTLLYEARLVWAGQPLYRPLSRHEFVSAPYPPIHAALMALFDQIGGPNPFWGGRLVSALAAFGIGLLIILIIWAVGRSWLAGVLGAAIFCSAPVVVLWSSRIKPDMLAICFATIGLLCALLATTANQQALNSGQSLPHIASDSRSFWKTRAWAWLTAAAIWFTIAFFTRQTTLMAAFAVSVALVLNDLIAWRRNQLIDQCWILPFQRRTVAFGVLLVGLMLSFWGLADLITAGQYTAHVWGLHRSEWWSLYLVQKYALRLMPYWPALLLVLPLLAWAIRNERARMLACYVLIAPITLLGAAEISANHNHLLESHLAIGLACGAAVAWAVSRSELRKRMILVRVAILVLFALQLWVAYQPQKIFEGEFKPSDSPQRFVNFIQQTPGEILADDVGLLIAGGKPVRYDDPSTMGPAARWGIWDQSGLVEEIAQHKFSAIMIRDDVENDPYDEVGRWTSEMRAAIRTYYVIKFRDRIRVYVPKQ
jgi:hypothetical protein